MTAGKKWFLLFTVLILLLFALFTAWNILDRHNLRSRLEKLQDELTVSIGREAKQQAEYDAVSSELPLVCDRIQEVSPRAEEADSKVKELKNLRKQLRQEKKQLENLLVPYGSQAEVGNDEP